MIAHLGANIKIMILDLILKVVDMIPDLILKVADMILDLILKVVDMIPDLILKVADMIPDLILKVEDMIPDQILKVDITILDRTLKVDIMILDRTLKVDIMILDQILKVDIMILDLTLEVDIDTQANLEAQGTAKIEAILEIGITPNLEEIIPKVRDIVEILETIDLETLEMANIGQKVSPHLEGRTIIRIIEVVVLIEKDMTTKEGQILEIIGLDHKVETRLESLENFIRI
jgi:hypothetical protein